MASLGQICIVGAFGLALYAIIASLAGARARSHALIASGQNAAWGVTALISAAALTLLSAFAVHDFTLRYVWEHSSRAMSLDLVLAAFYSGQQGSLLYWAWTLSIFAAIVFWQQRKPGPDPSTSRDSSVPRRSAARNRGRPAPAAASPRPP